MSTFNKFLVKNPSNTVENQVDYLIPASIAHEERVKIINQFLIANPNQFEEDFLEFAFIPLERSKSHFEQVWITRKKVEYFELGPYEVHKLCLEIDRIPQLILAQRIEEYKEAAGLPKPLSNFKTSHYGFFDFFEVSGQESTITKKGVIKSFFTKYPRPLRTQLSVLRIGTSYSYDTDVISLERSLPSGNVSLVIRLAKANEIETQQERYALAFYLEKLEREEIASHEQNSNQYGSELDEL